MHISTRSQPGYFPGDSQRVCSPPYMIDGMLFPARCAVSPYQRLYSQSLARGYYGKGGLKMKAGGWPGVPVGAGVQWEAWILHFGYQWPWYTQGVCLRLARGLDHWPKFVRSSTVLPLPPHQYQRPSLPCPREEDGGGLTRGYSECPGIYNMCSKRASGWALFCFIASSYTNTLAYPLSAKPAQRHAPR